MDKEFRGKGVFSKLADKQCGKISESGVKLSYAVESSPVAAGKHYRRGAFILSNNVIRLIFIKYVDRFIKDRGLQNTMGYKNGSG